jgi:hypothetical protein
VVANITKSAFDGWLNTLLGRIVVNGIVVFSVMLVYEPTNHHPLGPPITVSTPSWVPFWPVFLIPYLGMSLLTCILPLAIRDGRRFRSCMIAVIVGWMLIVPWWILTPTMLPRPTLSDGPWAGVFQLVWICDAPYNVTPCAHGVGPVVAGWFVCQERPAWRGPMIVIVLVGLASIALVWQHRPVDILLGTVAAVIGIAVAEALNHREPANVKA